MYLEVLWYNMLYFFHWHSPCRLIYTLSCCGDYGSCSSSYYDSDGGIDSWVIFGAHGDRTCSRGPSSTDKDKQSGCNRYWWCVRLNKPVHARGGMIAAWYFVSITATKKVPCFSLIQRWIYRDDVVNDFILQEFKADKIWSFGLIKMC